VTGKEFFFSVKKSSHVWLGERVSGTVLFCGVTSITGEE